MDDVALCCKVWRKYAHFTKMNLYNKWDDFFRFDMYSISHRYNTVSVNETSVDAEIHDLRQKISHITSQITKNRQPHIDHKISV